MRKGILGLDSNILDISSLVPDFIRYPPAASIPNALVNKPKLMKKLARDKENKSLDYVSKIAKNLNVTKEDLLHYKKNGCISIKFGIESGSQTMLDIMEKKLTTSVSRSVEEKLIGKLAQW